MRLSMHWEARRHADCSDGESFWIEGTKWKECAF